MAGASGDLAALVAAYVRGDDADSASNAIVDKLTTGKAALVDLVEELGSSLASKDANLRIRGTFLLSGVLALLPVTAVDAASVTFLVGFYCERLKDHQSTKGVASGLCALLRRYPLPEGSVTRVLTALFADTHVQSLPQESRQSVFELMVLILTNHLKEAQTLGPDFVFGFLQQIDGEKDPRCLLTVFSMVVNIASNFPIDRFAEDLFEVSACYFPITFNPPPNDPYGITKEKLINGLRACLHASPLFAPFCLEMLMDKITSTINETKTECFNTLRDAARTFGYQGLAAYLEKIMVSVRVEVFQNSSSDVQNAALDALRAIVHAIATTSPAHLAAFIAPICDAAVAALSSMEDGVVRLHGCVLRACCSGSAGAAAQVLAAYAPAATAEYAGNTMVPHRETLLLALEALVRGTAQAARHAPDSPLPSHKDALYGVFMSGLTSVIPQLKRAAIIGLLALQEAGVLAMPDTVVITRQFAVTLLHESNGHVRQACLDAAVAIATAIPMVIVNQLLPSVFEVLTEKLDASNSNHTMTRSESLETCVTLSVSFPVISSVLPTLMSVLARAGEDWEGRGTFAVAVANAMATIVEKSMALGHQADAYVDLLVNPLLRFLVTAVLEAKAGEEVPYSEVEVLTPLAACIRAVAQQLSDDAHSAVTRTVLDGIAHGNTAAMGVDANGRVLAPLSVESSISTIRLISLLTPVLCTSKKTSIVPLTPTGATLVSQLLSVALRVADRPAATYAAQCIAGLINKWDESDALTALLTSLFDTVESARDAAGRVTVLAWVCKALVMRAHPLMATPTSLLVQTMGSVSEGQAAADAVYIVMSDCKEVLSAKTRANLRLMYKQRFFQDNVPALVKAYHGAAAEAKQHYLRAISHTLRCVPKQVLVTELPSLLPLLVESLSAPDTSIKVSSLDTLYTLVFDAPELISQHVDMLVEQSLALAAHEAMKVRISALQLLGALTSLPPAPLKPHANKVVQRLARCLDDPKRLVRKEAVKCRNEWFLL